LKLFLLSPILAIVSLIHIRISKKGIKGKGFANSTFAIFLFFIMYHLTTSGRLYLPPRSICATQLKIIGRTMIIDLDDSVTKWPLNESWCDILHKEGDIPVENFKCPKDDAGPCSYVINKHLPSSFDDMPANMVLLFEGYPGWNQAGGPEQLVMNRHGQKGCVILFADGRVQFVKSEDIPNLRWTLERDETHNSIESNIAPHVSEKSIHTFQGQLKEIHNILPIEVAVDFSALVYEVTDSMSSPAIKGTQLNVFVTKNSISNTDAFKTIIHIDKIQIGQYHQVKVSTELPNGWDALKMPFSLDVIGPTAGLEIIKSEDIPNMHKTVEK
jgi:prepilin-type processing-associated H-X9-DG protein